MSRDRSEKSSRPDRVHLRFAVRLQRVEPATDLRMIFENTPRILSSPYNVSATVDRHISLIQILVLRRPPLDWTRSMSLDHEHIVR